MALTLLTANNAQTVLAAGISASATTLTVNTGTGALFPSPLSGTSYFKLTLIDATTGQLTEIVHVTARTGDTMTISRAQEGTTARAWSANDIAANMLTAGTIALLAPLDSPSFTGTPLAPTAAPGTSNNQLANTAFIQAAITALLLGTASQRNVGTGANQIPDMSSFTFTTTGSGIIIRLPGGIIIQMDVGTTDSNGFYNVNMGVAMSNYQVFAVEGHVSGWTASGGIYQLLTVYGAEKVNANSFNVRSATWRASDHNFIAQPTVFNWLAFGEA